MSKLNPGIPKKLGQIYLVLRYIPTIKIKTYLDNTQDLIENVP